MLFEARISLHNNTRLCTNKYNQECKCSAAMQLKSLCIALVVVSAPALSW